jgi:DNA polymerase III alpha subunit
VIIDLECLVTTDTNIKLYDDFLRFKVAKGLKRYDKLADQVYRDRMEYELGVIRDLSFSPYFLICADLCTFMRKRDILHLVRGSGCGSLCVWAIQISHKWLDPIVLGLPFERFLNKDRISNPDLDMDIQADRRQEVVAYTVEKYGKDRVSRICNFNSLGAKQAIQDVARVQSVTIPDHVQTALRITALISGKPGTKLADELVDNEALQDEAARYPDLFKVAKQVEGKVRQPGVHAAGTIIAPDRLTKYLPLYYPSPEKRDDDFPSTQADMYSCEAIGLLKMDYLGLKTLQVMDETRQLIKLHQMTSGLPADFDIDNVPQNDPATWKLLAEGRLSGVFQVERHFVRSFARRMNLDKTMDPWQLAILVAIIRPGMMDAGFTETYLRRAAGQELAVPLHPLVGKTLERTLQCLCFQEDVMTVAVDFAGFTMGQADILRKGVGKKKPEFIAKMYPKFRDGAFAKGAVAEDVDLIWGLIEKHARYCVPGDSYIDRFGHREDQWRPTVSEMYKVRHDPQWAKANGHKDLHKKYRRSYGVAMSMGGDYRVRPNPIHDIEPMGDQECFLVTMESGRSIEVTSSHKFPVPNRGEIQLADLLIGDELFVHGEYEGYVPGTSPYRIGQSDPRGGGYAGCGFPQGDMNPAFTDGEWTAFKNVRDAKIQGCSGCEECKKVSSRYELHHRDGSRQNNTMDNLELLCPSCHKKIEYQAGRRRRGEKGYPVHTESIVSIVSTGIKPTFNVAMSPPNHNFCVNRIVTSNSFNNAHAAAYGIVGTYQTAYLKANYGLFYMNSLINSEAGGTSREQGYNFKVSEYVEEARHMGIDVVKPSVKFSRAACIPNIVENKLYFGLSLIKGVSDGAANWIVEQRTSRPVSTIHDFMLMCHEVVPTGRKMSKKAWNHTPIPLATHWLGELKLAHNTASKTMVVASDTLAIIGNTWASTEAALQHVGQLGWQNARIVEVFDYNLGRLFTKRFKQYETGDGFTIDGDLREFLSGPIHDMAKEIASVIWTATDIPSEHDEHRVYTRIGQGDLEAMCWAGALDCFFDDDPSWRPIIAKSLPDLRAKAEKVHKVRMNAMNKSRVATDEEVAPFIEDLQAITFDMDELENGSWSMEGIIDKEKSSTGCYLSMSPFAPFLHFEQTHNMIRPSDLLDGHYIEGVFLGVMRANRVIVCKKGKSKGKEMAFFTVSGVDGDMEVICFPETWDMVSHKKFRVENNKVYAFHVKKDARGGGMICQDMTRYSGEGVGL